MQNNSALKHSSRPGYERGWGGVPHTFFRHLPKVARPGVREVIGLVLDYTVGEKGQPEWTRPQYVSGREITFQQLLADTLVRSVDSVSRDLVEAEAKGMIRSKISGRTKLYQAVPENFTKPACRKPRVLNIDGSPAKKGPTSERVVSKLTHHVEVGECNETSEIGRSSGEYYGVDSEVNSECYQETGIKTYAPSAEVPSTEKNGPERPTPQPDTIEDSEDRNANLTRYCLQTISPKLVSVPPKNIISDALTALGDAPIKMLESRIALKLPKITAWGMVILLAKDVLEAWRALGVPLLNRSQYRLDDHWASAAEVRRLNVDPLTPAEVKREILLMWPELTPGRRTKEAERRESYERSIAMARELDRLYPTHLSHPNKGTKK